MIFPISGVKSRRIVTKIAPFEMSLLTYLLTHADNVVICKSRRSVKGGCVVSGCVLDFLVGLECQEENRPFSGQQHQSQFGLNPAMTTTTNFISQKQETKQLQNNAIKTFWQAAREPIGHQCWPPMINKCIIENYIATLNVVDKHRKCTKKRKSRGLV